MRTRVSKGSGRGVIVLQIYVGMVPSLLTSMFRGRVLSQAFREVRRPPNASRGVHLVRTILPLSDGGLLASRSGSRRYGVQSINWTRVFYGGSLAFSRERSFLLREAPSSREGYVAFRNDVGLVLGSAYFSYVLYSRVSTIVLSRRYDVRLSKGEPLRSCRVFSLGSRLYANFRRVKREGSSYVGAILVVLRTYGTSRLLTSYYRRCVSPNLVRVVYDDLGAIRVCYPILVFSYFSRRPMVYYLHVLANYPSVCDRLDDVEVDNVRRRFQFLLWGNLLRNYDVRSSNLGDRGFVFYGEFTTVFYNGGSLYLCLVVYRGPTSFMSFYYSHGGGGFVRSCVPSILPSCY